MHSEAYTLYNKHKNVKKKNPPESSAVLVWIEDTCWSTAAYSPDLVLLGHYV